VLRLRFRFDSIATLLVVVVIALASSTERAQAQVSPVSTAAVRGVVTNAAGKTVANATVSLRGAEAFTTKTATSGDFSFANVPYGTYSIFASSPELGTVVRDAVTIDGDLNISIAFEKGAASGPQVIGTVRAASAQINVTPASVARIDPLTAAMQGTTSWRHLLEQIPGVTTGGYDGGFSNASSVPGNPFTPQQVSVNGALPYETAVLLDGMPIIGQSYYSGSAGKGTDLSFVPLLGFGSADVVRGPGAASPSIVDSIGGSLLLRAPVIPQKNRYEFSVSTDPYGGWIYNGIAAMRLGHFGAVVSYGVNTSPGPINGKYATAEASTPATVNGQPYSCTSATGCSLGLVPVPYNTSFGAPEYSRGLIICCDNVSSAWTQHTRSLSLLYDFSDRIRASVTYAGLSNGTTFGLTPYWSFTFRPPASYTGSIPAGPIDLLNAGTDPNNYLVSQSSSLLEEKITAAVGVGMIQIAAMQNRDWETISFTLPKSAQYELYGGGTLAGAPVVFDGGTYTLGYNTLVQSSAEWTNNRDLMASYTTPITPATSFSGSVVRSYYNSPLSSYYMSGATTSSSGVSPANSNTTNEFKATLGWHPRNGGFSADLSDYIVGSAYHVPDPTHPSAYVDRNVNYTAPRLGMVYHPNQRTAFRASAGGGIALAPLSYLVGSNGVPTADNAAAPSLYTVTRINTDLKPETSFGFDVGTDLNVAPATVVSFDLYRSTLHGQLFQSINTSGTFNNLPLYVSQYQNLGVSRYEGLILDARHDPARGINWRLSGGFTRGYVVSLPAGFYNTATCTNCTNLYVVKNINFDGAANGAFGAPVPYAQVTASLGYRWQPEEWIRLAPTYYGSNNSYYRPAFTILNADASIPVARKASLLLHFMNITNVYGGVLATRSLENVLGAPAIAGPPYALYGQEYGPRSLTLTLNVKP
jgi:hypothetical protein